MKRIYIIWDKLAMEAVGIMKLHLYAHDAAAIRFFGDIASDKQSTVSRHPADYELHCIGNFDSREQEMLTPMKRPVVVITGEQWLAAQQQSTEPEVRS